MPPRKTQTIKDVMKESQPIIDQKLGATRSKKVKKNDSDEESDFVTTSSKSKQKNSSTSSKIKSSSNKQKESIHQSKDDPIDKLSPELKPSSQRQKARTKAEKMQEKHNSKAEEVKAKQQNEEGNKEQDNDNQDKKEPNQKVDQVEEENKDNKDNSKDKQNDESIQQHVRSNEKNQNENQENSKNQEQEPSKPAEQDKNPNVQENEHKDVNNKELLDKRDDEEQRKPQAENNQLQNQNNNIDGSDKKASQEQQEEKQDQQLNESNLKMNLKNNVNTENVGKDKADQQDLRQREEEAKEQLEKQLKVVHHPVQNQETDIDIVFCCDVTLLEGHNVDQLKHTIEYIIQQLKQKQHLSSRIKFSIVVFNDIITNQKVQQCQVIDLCNEAEILSSLEEIKQAGQAEIKKGFYYGLKLATLNTKWRKESSNKSYRYIIHIANQHLELDNKSEELELIIKEMNTKNIRYKYLRIDKRIDLDFDGKQYFQKNLNSYEESFLKEFGCLKNVVSSIILRELTQENIK
ncbi:unnamed protein product [Paramecium octaurelia]|uniref:VWFA domain-containing protein n=1 Tax=Paramecium octaurelia TaxID=43137 RepID=A0A8S1WZ92_PAROT|nr:unnamed protein product [Paramecium octaurelia]